ncbi:hypothetical protein HDV03_003920 [Kappamyces sp. JEL0829]|nr:hypothetical protein HDV03_003920 [Kappamyces sp. JEL0829]
MSTFAGRTIPNFVSLCISSALLLHVVRKSTKHTTPFRLGIWTQFISMATQALSIIEVVLVVFLQRENLLQVIGRIGSVWEDILVLSVGFMNYYTLELFSSINTTIPNHRSKLNMLWGFIWLAYVACATPTIMEFVLYEMNKTSYSFLMLSVSLELLWGGIIMVIDIATNFFVRTQIDYLATVKNVRTTGVELRLKQYKFLTMLILFLDLMALAAALLCLFFGAGYYQELGNLVSALIGIHSCLQLYMFLKLQSIAVLIVKTATSKVNFDYVSKSKHGLIQQLLSDPVPSNHPPSHSNHQNNPTLLIHPE